MGALLARFSFTLPMTQSHAGTTTIPFNEFNSGSFKRAANC